MQLLPYYWQQEQGCLCQVLSSFYRDSLLTVFIEKHLQSFMCYRTKELKGFFSIWTQ